MRDYEDALMNTNSRLIAIFAAMGFLISVLVFAYVEFVGVFEGTLYTGFVVLCPPSLLRIMLNEVMNDKFGFYAIWLLIGLLNSGLYAVIGAAYVGLREKSD
jgi:hypothetical protein